MEDANKAGNTHKLYQIIHKCSEKNNVTADGTVVSQINHKLQAWANHFSDFLNLGSSQLDGNIDPQYASPMFETLSSCSVEPPSRQEISAAIQRKNNKLPGNDNIPPEFFKVAAGELAPALHSLFSQMWAEDKVPSQWNVFFLIPVFKKGTN
jgi:hypothetical protein